MTNTPLLPPCAGWLQDKYDAEAARIIRLLREKRYLDAEQISDIALLPAKKARSILYRLFQDGIIRKQEIPRRSDYDPEYTFFLWGLVSCKQLQGHWQASLLTLH